MGKTNKHGFRNVPKNGDENRIFGVPTIRDDIKKTGIKSVADPNVITQFELPFGNKMNNFIFGYFINKYRIMEMKNQRLDFFSLRNMTTWESAKKISTRKDQNKK